MSKVKKISVSTKDPIWDSGLVTHFLEHSDECDLVVQKRPGAGDLQSENLNLMLVPKVLMRQMIKGAAKKAKKKGFQ